MDSISIRPGLRKFSSDNWAARLFILRPGYVMTRDMAPELKHLGLYASLAEDPRPAPMPRHMPLFGADHPFETSQASGAMFLTSSRDDLTLNEVALLSDLIFGTSIWKSFVDLPDRIIEMEHHFRSLMAFETAWIWGQCKPSFQGATDPLQSHRV